MAHKHWTIEFDTDIVYNGVKMTVWIRANIGGGPHMPATLEQPAEGPCIEDLEVVELLEDGNEVELVLTRHETLAVEDYVWDQLSTESEDREAEYGCSRGRW